MKKKKERKNTGKRAGAGGPGQTGGRDGRGRKHTPALRVRLAQEVVDRKVPASQVSQVFGVAYSTLVEWVRRYRAEGVAAFDETPRKKPPATKAQTVKRAAVTALRESHPEYGTRRIGCGSTASGTSRAGHSTRRH